MFIHRVRLHEQAGRDVRNAWLPSLAFCVACFFANHASAQQASDAEAGDASSAEASPEFEEQDGGSSAEGADSTTAETDEAPEGEAAGESTPSEGAEEAATSSEPAGADPAQADPTDVAAESEGAGDADEATAEPPNPVDLIQGRPDAPELATGELWEAYESTYATFERRLTAVEEADPRSTTGYRVYIDAIESSMQLSDLLEELLNRDGELSAEEEVAALDSLLTIRQVVGSMLVEIQECERAAEILEPLAAREETLERPLLYQGTQRWLQSAQRCIERQALEAEVRAAEEEGYQAEVARLREELAAAQAREEELREEQQAQEERAARATEAGAEGQEAGAGGASGDEEIRMSRGELLALLRMSATDRQAAYQEAPTPEPDTTPRMEYGFQFYGGVIGTPDFALDALFDVHPNHWRNGSRNYTLGGEFFFRKRRSSALSVGLHYTDLGTETHWWVRNNKPRGDAKWTENNLQTLTAAFGFETIAPLDRRERLQFFFNIHLGLSFVLGDFVQTEVDESCLSVPPDAENGGAADFRAGGSCLPTPDAPAVDPSTRDSDVLPPVLPSVGIGLGLRYMIADRVQIGVETGFRDVYFYGTGNIGVIFARRMSDE